MSRKWLWIAVGASPRLARSRSMGRAPSGADTIPHPLPRLVGTRRGCKMAQAGILRRIRARWPGSGPAGAAGHPRRAFGSFFTGEKGTRPKGETLQGAARRVVAPYGRRGPRGRAGQETRPYNISGKSQQDGNAGWTSPSPTGWRGNIPRRRTGGRLPESSFELPWGTQAG